MKKIQCICNQADSTKMQRHRCRQKSKCGVPPQQTGRKPVAQKEDPRVVTARYEQSDKGKWRKLKRRRKQRARKFKEKLNLAKLGKPKEEHVELEEGYWTPVPPKAPRMAEPLPERKRGQLPEDFWEEVLERRATFFRRRSAMEFVRCERCHWFKYCASGFWKGESRKCPRVHNPKCEYFDM